MIALESIANKLETSEIARRGVINLSFGGSRSYFSTFVEYFFDQIIENGGIVFTSAGNNDGNACDRWPGWTTKVITVGSANYDLSVCITIFNWNASLHYHWTLF